MYCTNIRNDTMMLVKICWYIFFFFLLISLNDIIKHCDAFIALDGDVRLLQEISAL